MDQVIHPDQTSCIPKNIPYCGYSRCLHVQVVHQEKSFDRVECLYLWGTLKAFGFCQDFINKIRVSTEMLSAYLKLMVALAIKANRYY